MGSELKCNVVKGNEKIVIQSNSWNCIFVIWELRYLTCLSVFIIVFAPSGYFYA
jgi:hypothetical protein